MVTHAHSTPAACRSTVPPSAVLSRPARLRSKPGAILVLTAPAAASPAPRPGTAGMRRAAAV
jgi:hypothetical protein